MKSIKELEKMTFDELVKEVERLQNENEQLEIRANNTESEVETLRSVFTHVNNKLENLRKSISVILELSK